MDNNLDHYVVLGLLRNASTVEIRKAYLKLSLVYHPDKNNGAGADKFRQVKEAYDILYDTTKRQAYDLKFKKVPRDNTNCPCGTQKETFDQSWARRKQEAREAEEFKAQKAARARREQEAAERSKAAGSRARAEQRRAAKARLDAQKAEEAKQTSAAAAQRAQRSQKQAAPEFPISQMVEGIENLMNGPESLFSKIACLHEAHPLWWRPINGLAACGSCNISDRVIVHCPLCRTKACYICALKLDDEGSMPKDACLHEAQPAWWRHIPGIAPCGFCKSSGGPMLHCPLCKTKACYSCALKLEDERGI